MAGIRNRVGADRPNGPEATTGLLARRLPATDGDCDGDCDCDGDRDGRDDDGEAMPASGTGWSDAPVQRVVPTRSATVATTVTAAAQMLLLDGRWRAWSLVTRVGVASSWRG
jgi:hypothetical protein